MIDVMMMLGSFMFSIDTAAYQELTRTNEYRWPAQERVSREAALQFVGPGQESLSLKGTIYPHYKGGIGQMQLLRDDAALGEPLLLVDGNGNYWGKYVIERVEETRTVFYADGTPRKIDFKLDLKYYGDDAYAVSV